MDFITDGQVFFWFGDFWYRFHILSQNYFSGPVETKLLSESERFSFPWWSTKRRMHGCRHCWRLGFCCHLCEPCDGSHKLEGRMWSLWSGLKSQMDAPPKVDGMGLGLRRISESYYANKWSNNLSNVPCFTNITWSFSSDLRACTCAHHITVTVLKRTYQCLKSTFCNSSLTLSQVVPLPKIYAHLLGIHSR